jgi:hypothetical protein
VSTVVVVGVVVRGVVVVDATVVIAVVVGWVVGVVVGVVTFEEEVVIVDWVQLASAPNNRTVASNVDIYLTI